mmetsp:Transcript_128316/g.209018  ORF Transcript_128316/g.209018 Transcript_128316/m.209018 type:complete len:205 (+) Transcript_128316:294-908(+)
MDTASQVRNFYPCPTCGRCLAFFSASCQALCQLYPLVPFLIALWSLTPRHLCGIPGMLGVTPRSNEHKYSDPHVCNLPHCRSSYRMRKGGNLQRSDMPAWATWLAAEHPACALAVQTPSAACTAAAALGKLRRTLPRSAHSLQALPLHHQLPRPPHRQPLARRQLSGSTEQSARQRPGPSCLPDASPSFPSSAFASPSSSGTSP